MKKQFEDDDPFLPLPLPGSKTGVVALTWFVLGVLVVAAIAVLVLE